MGTTGVAMADELDLAVSYVTGVLAGGVERDWAGPAGRLEWSCAVTVEHVGQALMHWASQLAVRADTRYVRWRSQVQEGAPPEGMIDFLEAGGRILALVARATPPDVRAFHPWGIADADGFAGMGCLEVLLHGKDLADGLGLAYEPPYEVCQKVFQRMFAQHADQAAGADPWAALQWASGRGELDGLPRLTEWKWRATPLDETWDPSPTPAPMRFTP
ncbi:hypothetical protein [Kribbella sp. NPDC006257]|uniref:hypothetical protein n=1 Tax=Kribbella sp. NPDC006257 TaxID=3156738 RepID=UPI0033B7705B